MDRLANAAELLDGALDDPVALRDNLRDLRRLNRLTGGVELSRRAIEALAGDAAELRLLDVGTGAADIPLALLASAASHRRSVRVTAVDSRSEVLRAAREADPRIDQAAGLVLETADGRALPYPDGAFDVAHASLVLHHLEPPGAEAFLRELARVARRGIVINDLTRGRLAFAGAWLAGRLLTGNRYTRHDAPLSVRRAYTPGEAGALMAAAGLEARFEVRGFVGHRWAIAAGRVPT